MTVHITLNPAERIRRLRAAEPQLTDLQVMERLGVTAGRVKAAMRYRGAQKPGRRA